MKKVIVFDLDDTLYDEISYVISGFKEVAHYLQDTYAIPKDKCMLLMKEKLTIGRGKIFDDTLKHYNCYSKKKVKECISIYRMHTPTIQLDNEAMKCLNRLKDYPLYIVTDGNKIVQNNKLKALGLGLQFRHCFITHRYGIKHSKPSPYCFQQICQREQVEPHQVVYIGDNITKDFVGIKPLGFKTIRIHQGSYKNVKKPPEYEAETIIQSLHELDEELLNLVF